MPGFDTRRLMAELAAMQFVADYWPVLLVILTALGTWAFCQAQIAWYRWRADEAADTVRHFMKENARLRKAMKAIGEAAANETDE